MTKYYVLKDYQGTEVVCEIPDVEDIETILLVTVSGDETLYVFYKDFTKEIYDSNETRWYSSLDNITLLHKEDLLDKKPC